MFCSCISNFAIENQNSLNQPAPLDTGIGASFAPLNLGLGKGEQNYAEVIDYTPREIDDQLGDLVTSQINLNSSSYDTNIKQNKSPKKGILKSDRKNRAIKKILSFSTQQESSFFLTRDSSVTEPRNTNQKGNVKKHQLRRATLRNSKAVELQNKLTLSKDYLKEADKLSEIDKFEAITKKDLLILSGGLSLATKLMPSSRVLVFISSTFDDTKFEQDYLLENAYPFLDYFCRKLRLQFDVVSMRWGVRSRSNNDHLTSELCLSQLDMCLKESVGISFITLQSHRYGYRPIPHKILQSEFEAIFARLQEIGFDTTYFEPPYWLLDETAVPPVYRLQPVSTLPGCEFYLLSDKDKQLCKLDHDFQQKWNNLHRNSREKWYHISNVMGDGFVKAIEQMQLSDSVKEKYLISVTHNEVNHGIVYNPQVHRQAIYIDRTITGIESAVANKEIVASLYIDIKQDNVTNSVIIDEQSQQMLNNLQRTCKSLLSPDQIQSYTVPWLNGDALDKSNITPPTEWTSYIQQLASKTTDTICSTIIANYTDPLDDDLLCEVFNHHDQLTDKLHYSGFIRDEVLDRIKQYVSEEQLDKKTPFDISKALVLHGVSGVGKSWIMCQAINIIRENYPIDEELFRMKGSTKSNDHSSKRLSKNNLALAEENVIIIYRLLGTSRDSSDAYSLIRSIASQCDILFDRHTSHKHLQDWESAAKFFSSCEIFEMLKENVRIILFLDSIDQLSSEYAALDNIAAWLPGIKSRLPSHVRVVVSTLPETNNKRLLTQMTRNILPESSAVSTPNVSGSNGASDNAPILGKSRSLRFVRSSNIVEITPIKFEGDENMKSMILNKIMDSLPTEGVSVPTRRILRKEYENLLIELTHNHPTPLFTQILAGIVSKWNSFSDHETNILNVKKASEKGVQGLIFMIFDELENKHGSLFVTTALSLITLSREGISEKELDDIISCDDYLLDDVYEWWTPPYRRLPPMLLQRLLSDLNGFIARRGTKGGEIVLRWYHRQFLEAAFDRYSLFDKSNRFKYYNYISNYFNDQSPYDRYVKRQPLRFESDLYSGAVNARRCIELPFALANCDKEGIFKCSNLLCDLLFIAAKVEVSLISELSEDYQTIISLASKDNTLHIDHRFDHYFRWFGEWKHRWIDGDVSVLQSALFMPIECAVYIDAYDLIYRNMYSVDGGSKARPPLVSSLSSPDRDILKNRKMKRQSNPWTHSNYPDDIIEWVVGKPSNISTCLITLGGHSSAINCVCYSPDGELIVTGSDDTTIKIWNSKSGECLSTLDGHENSVTSIDFAVDNRIFVSGSRDNTIKIWDAQSGENLNSMIGHKDWVNCVTFTLDGMKVISGSDDNTMKIWDCDSCVCLRTIYGFKSGIFSISCSPNNTDIVFCRSNHSVVYIIKNIFQDSFGMSDDVKEYEESLQQFSVSSSNPNLYSHYGHSTNSLTHASVELTKTTSENEEDHDNHDNNDNKLIDVVKLDFIALNGHLNSVTCVIYVGSDPLKVLSGSFDKTIRYWDLSTKQCLFTFSGHRNSISRISCSMDGNKLASSSFDKTIKIWCLKQWRCEATTVGHDSLVNGVMFSTKDNKIVSCSDDKLAKVWSLTNEKSNKKLGSSFDLKLNVPDNDVLLSVESKISKSDSFENNINYFPPTRAMTDVDSIIKCLAYNIHLNIIATSKSKQVGIDLYSLADMELVHLKTLEGHTSVVNTLCFLEYDFNMLLSGADDRTIRIWSISTAICLHVLEGHSRRVSTACCSSTYPFFFATGSDDSTIRIWKFKDNNYLNKINSIICKKDNYSIINCIVFSMNGKLLASGSDDKTVRIWNVEDGKCHRIFQGHGNGVTALCFSFEGNSLFSGSYDTTIKMWDMTSDSNYPKFTLKGHSNGVNSLIYTIDSQQKPRIISSSMDKTIKIWQIQSENLSSGSSVSVPIDMKNSETSPVDIMNNIKYFTYNSYRFNDMAISSMTYDHNQSLLLFGMSNSVNTAKIQFSLNV
eukprot:gene4550-6422_t